VKGDMTGKSLTGGGSFFGGGRKHFEEEDIFLWEIFCGDLWCEEFGFWGFLVNQKQGAPVCWGFWARGPGYPYGILELGSQTGCS
jgi:hypothetical protein